MDLSSVGRVDLTAVEALQRLLPDLRERGIELHLAEVRGPVVDRLKKTDLLGKLAHAPCLSLHEATRALAPGALPQGAPSLIQTTPARSTA